MYCCATNADVRTHPATLPRAARADDDDDDDDDDGTALELVSDRGAAIGEFDVVIDAAGLYSPLRSHRVYGNLDIIVDHLSRIYRLFAALNTPVQCWCPGLPEAEWGAIRCCNQIRDLGTTLPGRTSRAAPWSTG